MELDPFGLDAPDKQGWSIAACALGAGDDEPEAPDQPPEPFALLEMGCAEGMRGRCDPLPLPPGGMRCEFTRLYPTLTPAATSATIAAGSIVPDRIPRPRAVLPTEFRSPMLLSATSGLTPPLVMDGIWRNGGAARGP